MSGVVSRRSRGEFLTESWLSQLLIENLSECEASAFADLGSGRGSLVAALKDRWKGLFGSTVEIDQGNVSHLKSAFPDLNHLHLDVIDVSFPDKFFERSSGKVPDLFVSNPPYIAAPLSASVKKIIQRGGLGGSLGNKTQVPAEIIFMIQAIRLSPSAKEMAFILPDYILSASKNNYIRSYMIDVMGLYKVIEVGKKAFRGTDVKTHLAFFSPNRVDKSRIEIKHVSRPVPISITRDNFIHRGDYTYYYNQNTLSFSLAPLSTFATVERGNLPIYISRSRNLPVFHTTNFKEFDSYELSLEGYEFSCEFRQISKGDIVMGRVGRNILKQIRIVRKGKANHSDCILRIRAIEGSRVSTVQLLAQLMSNEGALWLGGRMKGSGAQSITISDVLNFPIRVEGQNA